MSSPTQRSMRWLKDSGVDASIVEYYHAFAKRKVDLFGMFDILGTKRASQGGSLRGEGLVIAVQTTTGSNVSSRVAKMLANPRLPVLLSAGWIVQVHGWRKLVVKRGGKAMRWKLRMAVIALGVDGEPFPREVGDGEIADFKSL